MSKKIKRWVKNEDDQALLMAFIGNMELPFTVTIEKGLIAKRSTDQNRLQRLWINEAEQQGDMTAQKTDRSRTGHSMPDCTQKSVYYVRQNSFFCACSCAFPACLLTLFFHPLWGGHTYQVLSWHWHDPAFH